MAGGCTWAVGKGRGFPAQVSLWWTVVIAVTDGQLREAQLTRAQVLALASSPPLQSGPPQSQSVQPKCVWVTIAARAT